MQCWTKSIRPNFLFHMEWEPSLFHASVCLWSKATILIGCDKSCDIRIIETLICLQSSHWLNLKVLKAKCFNKFSQFSKCFHCFNPLTPGVCFENYTWFWLTLPNRINKVKRIRVASTSLVTSVNASMSSTQELLNCVLI